MADVTGPISTLPGAHHRLPAGTMCDEHDDRPAVKRVQGETDSFGSEMNDMCQECYDAYLKYKEEMGGAYMVGTCDWCKGSERPLFNRRDVDEGMSGQVYTVCRPCIDKDHERLREELAEMDDGDDYFDDGGDE